MVRSVMQVNQIIILGTSCPPELTPIDRQTLLPSRNLRGPIMNINHLLNQSNTKISSKAELFISLTICFFYNNQTPVQQSAKKKDVIKVLWLSLIRFDINTEASHSFTLWSGVAVKVFMKILYNRSLLAHSYPLHAHKRKENRKIAIKFAH